MKKLRRFEDYESYDKFVESCGSDYEEIPMLIVVGNEIKADLMTECKSWKTALKRFDKVFMGLDEDLDGFLGEGFYESVESGYPSAADPKNYAYGIEEVNEGRWYIYVTCHKEEVQEEVKEEIKMAKKAVITEVTRNENIFTATYESGATKKVTVDTMPGTIRTWIEANAPELLRVVPTAEEMAELDWIDATEDDDIQAATFNLASVVPEVARQLEDVEVYTDVTLEGPEEVTEAITPATFEAPVIIADEATEEKETTTDNATAAGAVETVLSIAGTVAQAVVTGLATVAPIATKAAAWTLENLSNLLFLFITYLPLWAEKAFTVTTLLLIPRVRRKARKAINATGKAIKAVAPVILEGGHVVARAVVTVSLIAAGIIWRTFKATARNIKAGWQMRNELNQEWEEVA